MSTKHVLRSIFIDALVKIERENTITTTVRDEDELKIKKIKNRSMNNIIKHIIYDICIRPKCMEN